jgi:uncharacterized protein DUF2760
VPPPELSPLQRLVLAFYAFVAVLFRAEVALAVHRIRDARLALGEGAAVASRAPVQPTPAATPSPAAPPLAPVPPPARPPEPVKLDPRPALQLLALLQREGRLVDFLEEDLAGFPDASVGAAARAVHAGCKRALQEYLQLEPVMGGAEGARVTVERGFDAAAIRLTGNVVGEPPFQGSLRHHGWRAKAVKLPPPKDGQDASLLAPAEVEL